MNGIYIDILYHTDETRKLRDNGVEFDFTLLDVHQCYLTDFKAAHPVYSNGNEYTEIYLGGQTLICVLDFKQFITKWESKTN